MKRLDNEIGPKSQGCSDSTCADYNDEKVEYGKSVETPGSLIGSPWPRIYFSIRYSTSPLHKSNPAEFPKEITTVYADAYYNLVKYPIDNIEEYLANPTKYKNFISVPIKKSSGVHTVEINIGGVNYTYIIDSGASEMLISKSMETRLLDLGIIRNSDYMPSKTFTLADGTEKVYRRVKLSSVRMADLKVEDITVAITDDGSPLLLGKSFLDKFKSWKLNNSNSTIELTR